MRYTFPTSFSESTLYSLIFINTPIVPQKSLSTGTTNSVISVIKDAEINTELPRHSSGRRSPIKRQNQRFRYFLESAPSQFQPFSAEMAVTSHGKRPNPIQKDVFSVCFVSCEYLHLSGLLGKQVFGMVLDTDRCEYAEAVQPIAHIWGMAKRNSEYCWMPSQGLGRTSTVRLSSK